MDRGSGVDAAIEMLIDDHAILLYDDKMVITFNYKKGTQIITFDDVKKEVPEGTSGPDLDCLGAPKEYH